MRLKTALYNSSNKAHLYLNNKEVAKNKKGKEYY